MAEKKETKKVEKKPVKEKKVEKKVDKKTVKAVKPAKQVKPAKEKAVKKETKIEKVETPVKENRNVEMIHIKPLITEKAVMLLESQNVLTVETTRNVRRDEIKREVEDIFEVKVDDVRTLIRNGKKYAYVKLNPKNLAIDIATKLGMI